MTRILILDDVPDEAHKMASAVAHRLANREGMGLNLSALVDSENAFTDNNAWKTVVLDGSERNSLRASIKTLAKESRSGKRSAVCAITHAASFRIIQMDADLMASLEVFDWWVVDINLPRTNGPAILKSLPEGHVKVLVTGDGDMVANRDILLDCCHAFVEKGPGDADRVWDSLDSIDRAMRSGQLRRSGLLRLWGEEGDGRPDTLLETLGHPEIAGWARSLHTINSMVGRYKGWDEVLRYAQSDEFLAASCLLGGDSDELNEHVNALTEFERLPRPMREEDRVGWLDGVTTLFAKKAVDHSAAGLKHRVRARSVDFLAWVKASERKKTWIIKQNLDDMLQLENLCWRDALYSLIDLMPQEGIEILLTGPSKAKYFGVLMFWTSQAGEWNKIYEKLRNAPGNTAKTIIQLGAYYNITMRLPNSNTCLVCQKYGEFKEKTFSRQDFSWSPLGGSTPVSANTDQGLLALDYRAE